MSDLNLNFDTGSKSVVINSAPQGGGAIATGGITTAVPTQNAPTGPLNATSPIPNVAPNLSVAVPIGIEYLAKGSPNNSAENTPRSTGNESAGKHTTKSH